MLPISVFTIAGDCYTFTVDVTLAGVITLQSTSVYRWRYISSAIILSGDEKHKDTQQRPSRSRDTTPGCINVGPMKLVCLLVPSIMVVIAMLLALAMIHKVAKFHANQIKASKGTVAYLTDDRISLTFEEETSSDAIGLKMNNYDMAWGTQENWYKREWSCLVDLRVPVQHINRGIQHSDCSAF